MKHVYLLIISALIGSYSSAQNPINSSNGNIPIQKSKLKSKSTLVSQPTNQFDNHQERSKGIGHNSCKSHELTQSYYESIGAWDAFNDDYQHSTAHAKVPPTAKTPGVNNISVIFHVVHNPNNPAENVSNALIMQVFNDIQEDFQLLNSDASNARSAFGFTPADANINFCLATRTPAGVPLAETGVIRVSTTEDWYDSDSGEENKMKASATGGSQIWNRNNYLNVWICDISNGAGSGVAGYAYRPTTTFLPSSTIDGIVLDYNLGMNNDNVLTHEIGHYLGLDHTWGGSGSCSNDDGFADTPNTAGPSFNYSGSCSGNQTTCASTQTQYENYMDYSNCTVMYTQAQANYMLVILTGIRASLLASPGCDPLNIAPVANFNADLSSPIIIPVGGSVNFFDLSTNNPTSWIWNFGGGSANQNVQNPSTTFNTLGTFTVTLTAGNAFGSDQEIKTGYVQVVAPAAGTACDTLRNYNPVTEDLAYYNWQTPGWGFFPGTGRFGAAATTQTSQFADRFTAATTTYVKRLRFPIGKAVNQSGSGLMKIRVQQDNLGNPGTVLVTDTLLIADMDAGFYNEFDFTSPVQVTGNFWITFEMIYGTPLDSVTLFCVDFDYRNGTLGTGVNTMKSYYGSVWHSPSDINPVIISSMWLDVLTSNGPSPVADFTYSEAEVCLGGQITVNGSSSQNTTNYYWYVTDDPFTTILSQSSAAGNNFTFNQVANRRIYLFADGSCETDGLYLPVIVNAIPTAVVTATNTACGINNGSIVFSSPAGGDTPNYTYSIDGVNYQASPIFNNLAAGTYIVNIKTPGDNCDRTYTRVINPSSELTAGINPSVTICEGGSATLTASGGTSFTWYDGTTQIGTTASINVTPAATNQYTCIVSDGTCTSTVYTYVNVEVCNGIEALVREVKIYPNPMNDQFTIELEGNFNYKMVDVRGRLVNNGSAIDKVEVQTMMFESGVYFIEISTDAFIHTYHIVKK